MKRRKLLLVLVINILTLIFSSPIIYADMTDGDERYNLKEYLSPKEVEKYSPKIEIGYGPRYSIPDNVTITSKVLDIYSQIQNAILFYSIDNWSSLKKIKMSLIDGTPNNGTFLGILPPQKENSTVRYRVYFEDNLGYSVSNQGEYHVVSHKIIYQILDEPLSGVPVTVNAFILDSDVDVNNVTLLYSTNANLKNLFHKEMTPDSSKVNYYVSSIPAFKTNTTVTYYIESSDVRGHTDKIKGSYTVSPLKDLNKIEINVRDLTVNMNNQSAEFNITSFAGPIDMTLADLDLDRDLQIRNTDVNRFYNIDLVNEEERREDSHFAYIVGKRFIRTPLSEDPSTYPFDHYNLNLLFLFPLRNGTYDYKYEFNDNVYNNWVPKSSNLSKVNNDYYNNRIKEVYPYDKIGSKENFIDYLQQFTLMYVKFDLNRNYTIAIIIVPLIAIFYLLGAIFIFENSSDNIGNRLALTLGIFALIFTLPEIINSMKPATSGPTIADSMLSIIIIATIAFTVSSVLSSSPL